MMNAKLVNGWGSWRTYWEEKTRAARLMSAFIQKLMNRELARGYGAVHSRSFSTPGLTALYSRSDL